jgi:hypothetical protein
MQGGKNWILPKELKANRFFRVLIGWKSRKTTSVPLWERIKGAWLWTQGRSCKDDRKTTTLGRVGLVLRHIKRIVVYIQKSCLDWFLHDCRRINLTWEGIHRQNKFDTGPLSMMPAKNMLMVMRTVLHKLRKRNLTKNKSFVIMCTLSYVIYFTMLST